MTFQADIVVTGGAGFIGSHLVGRLLSRGKRVAVVDDCSTGCLENLDGCAHNSSLKIFTERISDCSSLRDLVASSSFVVHLAAKVGVKLVVESAVETIRSNVDETSKILEVASEFKVPFLFASTSEVYGNSAKLELSEDDDLAMGSPMVGRWSYACSKLMDEFLVMGYSRERSLPTIIVRLFNVVGSRQSGRYGMVLPRFISAAKADQPIEVFGDGLQSRCFCDVEDAVDALVGLMECPGAVGEVFNVGSTDELKIVRLAELVKKHTKSKSEVKFVSYEKAFGFGFEDIYRRRPNLNKIRSLINFTAKSNIEDVIIRLAGC